MASGTSTRVLQITLAIVKPDVAVQPHLVKEVQSLILGKKFLVIRAQSLRLSRLRAGAFYAEHKGRFFYDRLVNYMSSGPIQTYVLAKDNAIADWRELMGPTKVFRTIYSHPDSIRGRFGLTDTRNSTHGSGHYAPFSRPDSIAHSVSDSDESAEREIKFFFEDFDYKSWYEKKEPGFRQGPVYLNKENFVHTLVYSQQHKDFTTTNHSSNICQ